MQILLRHAVYIYDKGIKILAKQMGERNRQGEKSTGIKIFKKDFAVFGHLPVIIEMASSRTICLKF